MGTCCAGLMPILYSVKPFKLMAELVACRLVVFFILLFWGMYQVDVSQLQMVITGYITIMNMSLLNG